MNVLQNRVILIYLMIWIRLKKLIHFIEQNKFSILGVIRIFAYEISRKRECDLYFS